MPAIAKGSKILVTGASSYIGQHCVQQLLQGGYKVVGTVREDSQKQELLTTFPSGLDVAIVKDIGATGAFDEHLDGITGILHVASPFHFNFTNPRTELIEPAKEGTLNIMKAAQKQKEEGKTSVQRIVLTSSTAAVFKQGSPPERFVASKDWNEESPKAYHASPDSTTDKMDSYRASKSIAERAGWDLYKELSPSWDLVSVAPGYVFGPLVNPATAKLNVSVGLLQAFFSGQKTDADVEPLRQVGNFVDVRDVAKAHIRALEVPEAGGQRYGAGAGPFVWQQVVDAVYAKFPEKAKEAGVPRGKPDSWKEVKDWSVFDCKETEEALGFRFIDLATSSQDSAESLWERASKLK